MKKHVMIIFVEFYSIAHAHTHTRARTEISSANRSQHTVSQRSHTNPHNPTEINVRLTKYNKNTKTKPQTRDNYGMATHGARFVFDVNRIGGFVFRTFFGRKRIKSHIAVDYAAPTTFKRRYYGFCKKFRITN